MEREIFARSYHLIAKKDGLKISFISFKNISIQYDKYAEAANQVLTTLEPFFKGPMSIKHIVGSIGTLRENLEKELKFQFGQCIDNNLLADYPVLAEELKSFISKKYYYFLDNTFRNEEIKELTDLTGKTANVLCELKYKAYKHFLQQQQEGIHLT